MNATLPDGNYIEYVYDPLGRRTVKKVNGTITEKYLWQGQTRLLAVYDGSDSLIMRFEYADARVPVKGTINGSIYYLSYDQVGSLKAVADSSGNVVKRIEYDSFGNIITDTDPLFTIPFGFAGGLHDRDINLVRFGYRDYLPEIGKWTAKDPIFFAGGDTDLYGYVLNDPVNNVDQWGTINPQVAASLVGAGIGAVVGGISTIYNGGDVLQGMLVGAAIGATAGFKSIGIASGAVIGAASDFGGQVLTNYRYNHPLFSNINTDSIAMSAMSGALAGGGAQLLNIWKAMPVDAVVYSSAIAAGSELSWRYNASSGSSKCNR